MKKIILVSLLIIAFWVPAVSFAQSSDDAGCLPGYVYSYITGKKCTTDPSLPVGCTSTKGYSPVTGQKCDSSTSDLPAGCTSPIGYSQSTGQSCGCNGTKYSTYNGQLCPNYSGNDKTPTISSVSGPASLAVGEKGKWKIKAKGSGKLTYSVSWGDQAVPLYGVTDTRSDISQSASFTHTYYDPGTYYLFTRAAS